MERAWIINVKKKNSNARLLTKRKRMEWVILFYYLFSHMPFMKSYVEKIRQTLYSICPFDEFRIKKKSVEICSFASLLSIFLFWLLFLRNPGIFQLALVVFYTLVLSEEILRYVAKRTETMVLSQMEKMLNDVRHFFYDTHSIVGALQEAEGTTGIEMRIHMEELIEVLSADDTMQAAEEYNRRSKNNYLNLFLSLCLTIQEYGDTMRNGESLFVRNLCDLRKDILNHLLQLKRLQVEFAGLTVISLIPLMLLPFIRTTAIETLPELTDFYSGTLGVVLKVFYFACTVFIYDLIDKMQDLDAKQMEKRKLLWRLEQIPFIAKILVDWERRHPIRVKKKRQQFSKLGECITVKQFFLEKLLFFCGTVTIGIVVLLWAKGTREGLFGYEICILLLCAGLFYFIPDFRLRYRLGLVRMNMLSEVTLFQSIILMQMFIPDITVQRILLTMEQFASYFRLSIQECINEFSFSVSDALLSMKESEQYEPFRRFCDQLLSVDKIGIIRSFEEVIQDREHFQKEREEDTHIMIKKKAGRAKIIAFVPMFAVMLTYLILPYGMEAARQFTMIMLELNAM